MLGLVIDAARSAVLASGPHDRGCQACRERDAAVERDLASLLDHLDVESIADAYRASGGLCLRHVRSVLRRGVPASGLRVVVEVARAVDAPTEHSVPAAGVVVVRAAGRDRDAAERARLRAHRPAPVDVAQSALDQALGDLAHPACPWCRAHEDGLVAALDHLAAEVTRPDRGSEDPPLLCARHLTDLAWRSVDAAGVVAAAHAAVVRAALDELDELLAELRDPGPAGWWDAVRHTRVGLLRRVDRLVRDAVDRLLPPVTCPICRAAEAAARRRHERFVAAHHDPRVQAAAELAHGGCVHHVLEARRPIGSAPRDGRDGDVHGVVPVAERTLATRLAIVAWELEEARRHEDRSFRHEPSGSEAVAWSRAAVLLDGRVSCGVDAATMRETFRG